MPRWIAFVVPMLACSGTEPFEAADDGGRPGAVDVGLVPDAGVGEELGVVDAGDDTGPRAGCAPEVRFLAGPLDSAERGPWPVGVRTVRLAGLTVEVWYPATPGSEAEAPPVTYDLRAALPASEQGKISDDDNPGLGCDCYRDLPVDEAFGPYPVIVFVHGTAGVRTQSLEQMTHWASRGFVVLAADHPGLWLQDVLRTACLQGMARRDVEGDVRRLVGAIQTSTAPLGFLGDRLDGSRIGMAGHSAGGGAISEMGDLAEVLAPLASRGVAAGDRLRSALIMGGTSDSVVAPSQQVRGYQDSPAPKRLVMIENAGHLAFSTFCDLKNGAGRNLVEVASDSGVCGVAFASFLFDCDEAYLEDPRAWRIVNHATTAAFEAVLQCRAEAEAELSATGSRFEDVDEFREALE